MSDDLTRQVLGTYREGRAEWSGVSHKHRQNRLLLSSIGPMGIDMDRFEQHLFKPESSFEILLRGHLWMENLINRILALHIVNTGALDLDRMGFRQKIDIAQAFGFISQAHGYALKALNRLRNKLAHNLMAEPSENEIRNLVNTLTGPTKAAFNAVVHHPDVVKQVDKFTDLRYWILCYVMELDYLCAMAQYQKANRVKIAQVHAARYASKLYGGKEISEEEARNRFNLDAPPRLDEIWIAVIDRNYQRNKDIQVHDGRSTA